MHKIIRRAVSAAFLCALTIAIAPPLRAAVHATFTVNSDLDEVDKTPGDGICKSKPSQKCTLRAAVQEANALGGKQKIKLPAGTFYLTRLGRGENNAKKGDLDIKAQITIQGAGADVTVINGNDTDRVFDLQQGALTLNKLTVRNGDSGSEEGGGGIYVRAGTLKTKLVRLMYNTTNPPAAYGKGGAIFSKAKVVLSQTELSNNFAGLGMAVYVASGSLDMTASLVANNSSTNGAAIDTYGTTTLTNSTVSANAGGTAGGIGAYAGTVRLNNVTIADNSASSGGGIHVTLADVYLRNSILEINHSTDGPACKGTLISEDYNIVNDKDAACTIAGTTTHDQYNTYPSLYTLRDDGGFTWTHPILEGSPAMDNGNPGGCRDNGGKLLQTDQRGMPRTADGDSSGGARCDVGSSELQP